MRAVQFHCLLLKHRKSYNFAMFAFKLFCITVIISVVRAQNSDDQYSVNILGYQCQTFETEVRRSLETSKAIIDQEDAQTFTDAFSVIPVIGQMAGIFPIMHRLLGIEGDWRIAFSKTIQDQTRRAIAENDVRVIEA